MSVPFGMKPINWERKVSDGAAVCSLCHKVVPKGATIDIRLDGY
jgi:hypothetical protein